MALLQTVTSGSYVPPVNVTTLFREVVRDVVTIIDPFATPMLDLMEGDNADSTIYQFPVDKLPGLVTNSTAGAVDVDGINTNGLLEGFEPNYSGTGSPYSAQPARLTNVVQIWGAKFAVTDTLKNARSVVGVRDPYAWEQMKAAKSIKKAKERRMFEPTNVTLGQSSDPRRMSALAGWLVAAQSGYTNPAGYLINQTTSGASGGTGGTITPDNIDTAARACKTAGGRPTHLFVGTGSKFDLSKQLRQNAGGLSAVINTSLVDAAEAKIIRNVDFYQCDAGPIQIMSDFQIPESNVTSGGGCAYLLEVEKLLWSTYVPLVHIPLAKTGYNTKGILAEEGTYAFLQPASSAIITNVTT